VISTIHSGIAAGVYARLINMEIEPFLLASAIIAILSIRLIRVNCNFCSKLYQPEPALLRLMPEELVASTEFRKGSGCEQCLHTGFSGRTALTELLVAGEVFRDAVLQKLPTRALQQVAIQQGMQTMWQNGIKKVVAGQTTLDEVMRVVAVDQL
jgi:type II secretory ATPase GspE/PulE/Tfp pilus assembly ATPase PilB-like protein